MYYPLYQPVELVRSADGMEAWSGYAAVFFDRSNPDTEAPIPGTRMRERIENRRVFDELLRSGNRVDLLWSHNNELDLASTANGTLSLSVDDKGLRFYAPFDPNDFTHLLVRSKLNKPGCVAGCSFGFLPEKFSMRKEGPYHVRTIDKIKSMSEISICNTRHGIAYKATSVELRHELDLWEQTQERIKRLRAK